MFIVVSADTLRPLSEDIGNFQEGGTAGLLNYDIIGFNNQFSGRGSRYYSANTELGFSSGDWLVRSRQMATVQDDVRSFQLLYTYARKTFVTSKKMLQIGQININNSVFPGAPIAGLQMVPDGGVQQIIRGGMTIEDIAQSQARVEIRQAGTLIHTTLVPAGSFRLPNIQLLNGNTDVNVRVIESNGEQRNFKVLVASLARASYTAQRSLSGDECSLRRSFENAGDTTW